MLKAAGFYFAVFVLGTATMVLAHKLDPQKPIRNTEVNSFDKRVSDSRALPSLKIKNMSPAEAHDI
jgi:hypothetical protein